MHRRINHANVTFARAEDAAAFLEYAQAEPFFIGGHHTSLDWATQPYVTPEYVRAQVNSGDVSRNLVILAVRPNVTETVLRRDLAHIHNLTVISVKFEDGNAYISTNSVGGALYARTCLKSRKLYKDMWVGFYKDECAGPLPPRVPHAAARVPPAKRGAVYNPYELLSGSEFVLGSSEDDEE
ncbi:hypothetical protein N7462_011323 [Penicillium macrosclerotiorum]|uniref:uncharacterized protein n=1 Tax=Penicillium macrosclerotiorum TaxID=303699 RepID=UPI0025484822|nr:uncharacterized protein N7462_011323 [Penicillium macrosclerotiorum]KAJ5666914.1 hypothetical protein N7462_011323 [Penicillium macrosclerotiorum]